MEKRESWDQHSETEEKTALWSVFPSIETIFDFRRNDPDVAEKSLPAFFRFARESGLISRESEPDFLELIREHENRFTARHPPMGLDFSDLMDRISGDRSVNHLVTAELLPISRRFRLPDVQASMISRMRKNFNPNTRAKQNLLRVIAFWIGLNRPYWGWNFLTLIEMKKRADPQSETDQNAGVRIAFQVTGRGDVLSSEAVEWLKGDLMECMKSLEMFYCRGGCGGVDGSLRHLPADGNGILLQPGMGPKAAGKGKRIFPGRGDGVIRAYLSVVSAL